MNEIDGEFKIGESKILLGENDVMYNTLTDEIDEETTIGLAKASDKLKDEIEGKINVLVDLNKVENPLIKARKMVRDRFENERPNKIALFGLHPVASVIASFVMGVSKKKDIRFFKSKEDVLAWLKEEI